MAAGIVGTLLVAVGAMIAFSPLVRFLRAGGWSSVRRGFVRAIVATAVTALATFGVSAWAHHLNSHQRNGGDGWYAHTFLVYALMVVASIGLWTTLAVTTTAKINLSPRALRWESWLALGTGVSTMAVVAGATTWWVQMGRHAPWFLRGARAGFPGSPWSLQLVATATIMMMATLTAAWGVWRMTSTNFHRGPEEFINDGQAGA